MKVTDSASPWNPAKQLLGFQSRRTPPILVAPVLEARLVAVWVIAAIIIGVSTAKFPLVGALVISLLAALLAPAAVILASVSWAILCRPGFELVHLSVAGFSVTEMDALVLVSLLAGARLHARGPSARIPLYYWAAFLAWPGWFVVRAALPQQGMVSFASPFVDLHMLLFYLFVFPVYELVRVRGFTWAVNWLAYLAYIACTISILGWIAGGIGALEMGESALLNLSPGPLVSRPGGEVLLPILAVLLVFGKAPLALRSRFLSGALLTGEILASQTLSIVLAALCGVVAVILVDWRSTKTGTRLLLVLMLPAALLLLSGALGGDSRFNLGQRSGENSAQYRVTEVDTVAQIIARQPTVLIVGTGPGSIVEFAGAAIHEVKRDTHSVFLTTTLKTGLIGTLLFALPMVVAARASFGMRKRGYSHLFGAFVSIAAVSISVPFLWTTSGVVAAMFLFLATVSGATVDGKRRFTGHLKARVE